LKTRLNHAEMPAQRITKNPRGRPVLPSAEKRLCILSIRLTESELLTLREEARRCGLALSELIRAKLFNGLEANASIEGGGLWFTLKL
jgi:hypothetical protein